MPSKKEHKLISKNRSAHHEYFIDETIECGVELAGAEVKSIRERACQITDTFAIIRGGECWLVGLHIHPYSNGGVWNRDPDRRKKLLLHRKEIDYLDGKLRNRGYALVPLELYFNDSGRVKLLLGLGRGKKLYDKREDMAKRDVQREIDRALQNTPARLRCRTSALNRRVPHARRGTLLVQTALRHLSHAGAWASWRLQLRLPLGGRFFLRKWYEKTCI